MSSNETAEAILIVIKRLAWWIFLLFVGIVALISVIAGVYWGLETWSRRAVEVKTLKGITLGDKIEDVFFRLGKFERSEKGVIDYDALAKQYGGTRITPPTMPHASPAVYISEEKRFGFHVKDGRVNIIFYWCERYDHTEVNGHYCGANGDDILKRFGPDIRILCDKENAKNEKQYRVYDTIKYGVRYQLTKNQVIGFIIADKHELQEMQGETWVPCP